MPESPKNPQQSRWRPGRAAAALLALSVCVITAVGVSQDAEEPAGPAQAASPVAALSAGLRIPALAIDAPMRPLGLRADGSLEVPSETDTAGWWRGGARPGASGPAVIVAHRDSAVGPALFYALPTLEVGESIWVRDARGQEFEYRVDRVERHSRDDFPTEAVYGPTPQPTLRLLTCGGDYDPQRGYADNWIVFAHKA